MANEPPSYEETVTPQQDHGLPTYDQSLATQEPSQIYSLRSISSKEAFLTPTSPLSISSTSLLPSYNIRLTHQQKAFRKRVPDIIVSRGLDSSDSPTSELSSVVASVIFDSQSSSSFITYPSHRGDSGQETTLRLESALMKEYATQISGETCYVVPASYRNGEFLLVEHKTSRSTRWARFVPPSPSDAKTNPPKSASLQRKSSPLRKVQSPFSRKTEKDLLGEAQDFVGALEIYRRDLEDNTRDEIVCVMMTVIERTKRMKAAASRNEKGIVVRSFVNQSEAMNVP
ncbi:hypothetical protein MMC14_006863 [Varicellaria rhodocarpa]|nr:hypothetical protein [Varicellaria rhodocarpa]